MLRLEDEAGVTQDRKSSISDDSVFCDQDYKEKVVFLEKSFKDAERLNLELKKDLHDKKLEAQDLQSRLHDVEVKYEASSTNEKMLSSKVSQLEPLPTEMSNLKEELDLLKKNKEDFDMHLELSLDKKDRIIEDLKKCLESSYDEISLLENGNKGDVKNRYKKMEQLQSQVSELQASLRVQQDASSSLDQLQEENKDLKEGFNQLTIELDKVIKEKESIEVKLDEIKESSENGKVAEILKDLEEARQALVDKEALVSNLELSNASLLENIDELSKNYDESIQKNTDILVASNEINAFNNELKLEMEQLKTELKVANEDKTKFETIANDLNVEMDELKSNLDERKANLDEDLNAKTTLIEELNLKIASYENEIESSKKKFEKELYEKSLQYGNALESLKKECPNENDEKLKNFENEIAMLKSKQENDDELKKEIFDLKQLLEEKENKLMEHVTEIEALKTQHEVDTEEKGFIEADVKLLQEIERLKSELEFANDMRKKLEEAHCQDVAGEKRTMLEKLSATLTCIEESFIGATETETSLMEESTNNLTISGTGWSCKCYLNTSPKLNI